MELLVFLVDNQGKVLSREELLDNVWPGSVITDNSLSQFIGKLRKALQDSARAPKYVETIPKRGYLLKADVRVSPLSETNSTDNNQASIAIPTQPRLGLLKRLWRKRIIWPVIILSILYPLWSYLLTELVEQSSYDFKKESVFSNLPGNEHWPRWSPNGEWVLFSYQDEINSPYRLLLKGYHQATEAAALTTGYDDRFPQWSTSGNQIAFVRRDDTRACWFMLADIQPLTSPTTTSHPLSNIRQVAECRYQDTESRIIFGINNGVVYLNGKSQDSEPYKVWRHNLHTQQTRLFSNPTQAGIGDVNMIPMPDVEELLLMRDLHQQHLGINFVLIEEGEDGSIEIQIDGGLANDNYNNLSQGEDDHHVYAVLDRHELQRIELNTGIQNNVYLKKGIENPHFNAINQAMLATVGESHRTIWQLDLDESSFTPLFNSSINYYAPSFDAHGNIFFASDQSGIPQYWQLKSNNTAEQLTDWNEERRLKKINMTSSDIGVAETELGGIHIYFQNEKRWVTLLEEFQPVDPILSNDGKTVYFSSFITGDWQIWQSALIKPDPQQITSIGGSFPALSPDEQYLYFVQPSTGNLWKRPITPDGKNELVHKTISNNYLVNEQGIYYYKSSKTGPSLEFLDNKTNESTSLYQLPTNAEPIFSKHKYKNIFLFVVNSKQPQDLILLTR